MGKCNMVRLGDAFDLQMGKTPSRNKSEYWNNGTNKWISIADMGLADKYIYRTKEFIAEDAVRDSGIKIVPKDTIIMSFKLSIGKTCIVPEPMYTNEAIMAFINKGTFEIDNGYIYYLFKGKDWSGGTNKAVMGATLNKATLSNIMIPLFPIETQKQISKTLDKTSEIINLNKKRLEELDNLINSLFYNIFGDPVNNERGWEILKLEKIGKIGSSKRVFVEELVEDGIPFYRGTEVGTLSLGENIAPPLFITKEHYNRLKSCTGVPAIGDLLMPSICPDGRIWCVNTENPFYFKDGRVLWIHLENPNIISVYLKYMLRQKFARDYNSIASGTTFAELKIFALKGLDVMLPPIELQQQFVEMVSRIEEQKSIVKQAITESKNLFNSLMNQYFD